MANPPTAQTCATILDPHEEIDFVLDCTNILEDAEQIDTYTLTVLAEAAALGLTIMSGSGRDDVLNAGEKSIKLWLEISGAYEDNAAFDGVGTALGIELEIVTNVSPARIRQRTFIIQVAKQ